MPLSTKDFQRAAKALGCDLAAIKAVTRVESRGQGFLPSGEPVVLFERHIMNRLLRAKGIIVRDQLDVVNTTPGGYKGGKAEHTRLAKAALIDRDCALQSCSWGMFQIMGFHWNALGYKTLQAFINDMYKSEAKHLDAFVKFILINPKLHKALVAHDWNTFAHGYNGPKYKANRYDEKLNAEYIKALKE